jgi:carbon monoxide dehydrogenase subunit G
MARYTRTIHVPAAADEAFAYLSRFSNTGEWDPGVAEAEQLTPDPVGLGSRFSVEARFLGRTVPLVYEITAFDAAGQVTVRAQNAFTVSEDTIVVVPRSPTSARVTYDADLRLRGIWRAFGPVLDVAFRKIGDAALEGLGATLARRAAAA